MGGGPAPNPAIAAVQGEALPARPHRGPLSNGSPWPRATNRHRLGLMRQATAIVPGYRPAIVPAIRSWSIITGRFCCAKFRNCGFDPLSASAWKACIATVRSCN